MELTELVVRHRDREERVRLERHDHGYRITVGEATYEVDVAHVGEGTHGSVRSLILGGRQHEVSVERLGGGRYRVSNDTGTDDVELMDPLTHLSLQAKAATEGGGRHRVLAYMPGRVVKLLVGEGDTVEANQGLVVLEAMKMENEIRAERPGSVVKVFVEAGQAVEGGDPLFEIA